MKQHKENEFNELFSSLEPEQPSMRFTKNVMDSIEGLPVAKVSKHYVSLWIVKGIAAVLVFTLLVSVIYVYANSDTINSNQLKVFTEQTSKYISLIAFVNIMLLLVFAERWITGKRRIQQLERLN